MIKNTNTIVNIIGIDPGTNTLGFSVIYFDCKTLTILSTFATTFIGEKLSRYDDYSRFLHGDRFMRLRAHEENLLHLFRQFQPFQVVAESNFMNTRRPQAYGALVETVSAIKSALYRFDPWKPLYLIDPPTVKKAIGAKGNADKEEVKRCLLKLEDDLHYQGDIPITALDEHSIDAIAIAYQRYRAIVEESCL